LKSYINNIFFKEKPSSIKILEDDIELINKEIKFKLSVYEEVQERILKEADELKSLDLYHSNVLKINLYQDLKKELIEIKKLNRIKKRNIVSFKIALNSKIKNWVSFVLLLCYLLVSCYLFSVL
jgi:hypothetical protein